MIATFTSIKDFTRITSDSSDSGSSYWIHGSGHITFKTTRDLPKIKKDFKLYWKKIVKPIYHYKIKLITGVYVFNRLLIHIRTFNNVF